MNKRLFAGLFLIILVLSSCQILKATPAVEPAIPTITPSVVITTSSRQPANTATITLPTETVDILATLTQRADDLLQAEMDAFPRSCNNPQQQILSPDHKQMARACIYEYQAKNQSMEIITQTGKKWELQFNDYLTNDLISSFYKTYEKDHPLAGELLPLIWSKDGKNLYFASAVQIDADGPCFSGFGIKGLYRIHVETGKITTVLYPPKSIYDGYEYAFSPDEKWLAYGKDQPYLLDLITGKITPLEDIGYAYNFTWSPDSSKLAFVFNFSKMMVFKVDKNTSDTLVNEEGMCLYIYHRNNPISIEVIDGNEGKVLDRSYIYDWNSEIITQPTQSPIQ